MRKQLRPDTPAILVEHGEKWTKQWLALREKNPTAKFTWYEVASKSAREWLLPFLKEMTQGHCALCDDFPLDTSTTEPIEHFKPKSGSRFPELAYAWENLYYCCNRCQSVKGEQWDERLLRPDAPEYRFEDYFEYDFTTGQMRANTLTLPERIEAATVTITIYGLDSDARRRHRKMELRDWQRLNSNPDSDPININDYPYRDYLEIGSENK